MHKLFADWYRQVDLSISAEGLNTRWGCVEAALKKLDANAVMQLTRVSFALPKPDGASGDVDGAAVALTFKEADVSFPMKGNDQLLRVLFGVTLAQAIEGKHALATFAALAVTSARCSGLVAAPASFIPSGSSDSRAFVKSPSSPTRYHPAGSDASRSTAESASVTTSWKNSSTEAASVTSIPGSSASSSVRQEPL